MVKSNWWFAPEKLNKTVTDLIPSATKVINGSTQIKRAMPLSIYMNGVYIAESYDKGVFGKGTTNDLMIVSSFQTGTSPTVQRIHFYKRKQEINQWVGNFFKTLVCSFSDFSYSHVTLRTQVYDIDDYEKYKDLFSAISQASGSVSVTFPVIAAYTAAAIPAVSSIFEFVNSLDQHDKILDDNLRLEITQENTGSQILQTGHWIYFREPQDEDEGLKVNSILQVVDANNNDNDLFKKGSYAVYSIRAQEAEEPQWEIDQKVAKLLSELEGKGNSGKAAIEFVRDTVEAYSKFKKLQRIQELQDKTTRTKEEEDLLKKLKSDKSIEPFLPKAIT